MKYDGVDFRRRKRGNMKGNNGVDKMAIDPVPNNFDFSEFFSRRL